MFGVCGLCRLFPLVILSSQRPCQEVKVALCQLSASCIASVGIEGEVGHEVVGYDVADKFAWHLVYVGYEEVGLCLFSVVAVKLRIIRTVKAFHKINHTSNPPCSIQKAVMRFFCIHKPYRSIFSFFFLAKQGRFLCKCKEAAS